jgi:hypothetical protein
VTCRGRGKTDRVRLESRGDHTSREAVRRTRQQERRAKREHRRARRREPEP